MDDDDFQNLLAKKCESLSFPARVRILQFIGTNSEMMTVDQLSSNLNIPARSMSYHLKSLFIAGFIERLVSGRNTLYGIRRNGVGEIQTLLASVFDNNSKEEENNATN